MMNSNKNIDKDRIDLDVLYENPKDYYISEMFVSIQGEGKYLGQPSIFIRTNICNLRCNFCFTGNTSISTQNGIKPIKDLIVGDSVLSYNFETNKVENDEVIKTFHRTVEEVYRLEFKGLTSQIFVTGEHPFYRNDGSWVKAKDLIEGDEIFHLRDFDVKNPTAFFNNVNKGKIFTEKERHDSSTRFKKVWTMKTEEERASWVKNIGDAKRDNPTKNFGKQNGNWQGGVREVNEKKRASKNQEIWKETRQVILERDNYTCQNCESTNDLVVHHINGDPANDDYENLAVLCRKCNSSENHNRGLISIENGKELKKTSRITSVTYPKSWARLTDSLDLDVSVYNFETKNNNYFAQGLLVHNCDSKYAWKFEVKGESGIYSQKQLVTKIKDLMKQNPGVKHIVFTGGEPMLQFERLMELTDKIKEKFTITFETSGTVLPSLKHSHQITIHDIHFSISPKLSAAYEDRSEVSGYYEVDYETWNDVPRQWIKTNISWKFVMPPKSSILREFFDFHYSNIKGEIFVQALTKENKTAETEYRAMKWLSDALFQYDNIRVLPRLHLHYYDGQRGY